MVVNPVNRIMRRLRAAEGYLELDLPGEAQAELETIEHPGPFEGPYMLMIGECLRAQEKFEEAIAPLRHAARSLPMPVSRQAWESLSDCLTKAGRKASAEDAAAILEHLEEQHEKDTGKIEQLDESSSVRVQIPHFGTVQLKFDSETGLTINVTPPQE